MPSGTLESERVKCFTVFRKLLAATRGQKNQEGKSGLGDHLAKKCQISKIMMMMTKMEMIRVTVQMTTMMMKMPMELLSKGKIRFYGQISKILLMERDSRALLVLSKPLMARGFQ